MGVRARGDRDTEKEGQGESERDRETKFCAEYRKKRVKGETQGHKSLGAGWGDPSG